MKLLYLAAQSAPLWAETLTDINSSAAALLKPSLNMQHLFQSLTGFSFSRPLPQNR